MSDAEQGETSELFVYGRGYHFPPTHRVRVLHVLSGKGVSHYEFVVTCKLPTNQTETPTMALRDFARAVVAKQSAESIVPSKGKF